MTRPLHTTILRAGVGAMGGLCAALLCVAALATPAAAQTTRVLGLNVDGDKVAPGDRADLFAVLQAKLRLYPNVELKNPPQGELTDEMIDLECIDLDAECLTRLGTKYQADQVVHVEVGVAGRRHTMRVRFVDVAQGKIAREKEVKAARLAELAPALEAEIETVFGPPPIAVPQGTLVVEVDSPDAIIQLGQDYLGTGTATAELAPGDYTVRVSQVGFEDAIKKVSVRSGETTTERVRLAPIVADLGPKDKKVDDDDDGDWVIWAVVGAVVVGGAIAIIAATAGGDDDVVRGPAVLGIDGSSAWRDPATIEGRR